MAGNEQVYQEAMKQGHSAGWDQNWEQAAQFYRRAVEEMPDRPQALTSLGLAYYEMQLFEEARVCYTQAAMMTPDDPLPAEKLAQIYERTGNLKEAAEIAMHAADMHLKLRDADKAIDNWTRVTRLIPEHLKAHSRLAMVYERLERKPQAAQEYLSVAALFQDMGQIEEAIQAVNKAVAIDPDNAEANSALELVMNNQTLPKPKRVPGSTGPLRMAAVRQMEAPPDMQFEHEGPDPIGEARQKALTVMAGLLFDVSSEDLEKDENLPKGLRGMVGGQDGEADLSKISLHLGLAIDFQTRAEEEEAAKELKKALDAGLSVPAGFFNLGMLYFRLDRQESAQRNLQRAVIHPDYTLACRLMIGDYYHERGLVREAAVEFLQALKLADIEVVGPELSDILSDQYETLIESRTQAAEEEDLHMLCQNITELLMQPNWRQKVKEARAQLPSAVTGALAMPLADILTQAESTEMVEALTHINQVSRQGFFRTAMEEAFALMSVAPTYLPLHIHMGELLLRQNRTREAIDKFTIVAETYACRGDANRATDILSKIVEIAPLDLSAHKRLIDRYIEQGQSEEAIMQYIHMADVQHRLAQMEAARKTYERALQYAQQSNADRKWCVSIMHNMADIDLQRLDWRQALRVYEQLRTLEPNDKTARKNLVELNLRMGKPKQAASELDNYLSYLETSNNEKEALPFLEKLVEDNEEMHFAHRHLAEQYQRLNQTKKAIEQWDKVAEMMVNSGDMEGAKQAIRAILVLNPPNAEKYRTALQHLD